MEVIMKKIKMSQVLMLLLLVVLLFITPLLSSSLRHTYLYFIINLLIIALGAEAGLLKAFSSPLDHHHNYQDHMIKTSTSTHVIAPLASQETSHDDKAMVTNEAEDKNKVIKVVEKSKSSKVIDAVKMEMKVKKCPSMPSLFFIGGGDGDQAHEEDVVVEEEEEEEEVVGGDDLSGQELFTKAETFIGNFYKQLKMQREDSWKRIHGFYQKAF